MNTPQRRKEAAQQYGLILLGSAILSFGLYNVHNQSGITEGGVLGLILLLQHWFHLSPAVTSPILDISCYLLAWKRLGNAFARYAVVATLAFSLFYSLWEQMPPMLPDLSHLPLLAAVVGGLFVGVGVGLVVRVGGACGGDDALVLVLAGWSKRPVSQCYLLTDLIVLLLSLSYLPVARLGHSLVTVLISSFTIDWVQRAGKKKEG